MRSGGLPGPPLPIACRAGAGLGRGTEEPARAKGNWPHGTPRGRGSAGETRKAMRCLKHPQTETYVRCAKCDTPICGECMVTGPVGLRCPACAKAPASPLFQPKAGGLVRAGVGGVATAVLLGWVVNLSALIG